MLLYTLKNKNDAQYWLAQVAIPTTGEIIGEGYAGLPKNAAYFAINACLNSDNPKHQTIGNFLKRSFDY